MPAGEVGPIEKLILDKEIDPITPNTVLIFRGINDPEHPLTLEQLDVVKLEHVAVDDSNGKVNVVFTPTIPHCSMATLIGLSIRVKLLRSLPPRFKVIFLRCE